MALPQRFGVAMMVRHITATPTTKAALLHRVEADHVAFGILTDQDPTEFTMK